MIGVARGALDAACKYVKERKQFGHPIGEFQAVQFQLAQAATELEAARLMVYNSARLEDASEPYTIDRKSTRLNSSHSQISYAVFCLKKKKHTKLPYPSHLPASRPQPIPPPPFHPHPINQTFFPDHSSHHLKYHPISASSSRPYMHST